MQSNFNTNEEIGLYDQFRMGVYNSKIKSSIYTQYIWNQDLNTLKKLQIPKEVQDIREQTINNRKNEKQTRFQYDDSIQDEKTSLFSTIQLKTATNKGNSPSNNLAVLKRSSKESDVTSRSHDILPPFRSHIDKSRNLQRANKKQVTESYEDLKSRVNSKRVLSLSERLNNQLGAIEELSCKNNPGQVIKSSTKELTQEIKSEKLLDVNKHESLYSSLFKAPEVLFPIKTQKKDKFISNVQSLRDFINPKLPNIPRIQSLKKKPENSHERSLAKITSDFGDKLKTSKRSSVPFTLRKSM